MLLITNQDATPKLLFGNRPVRTRMRGGVGAGGDKPPATRFGAD